jgi:predicted ferric reductase
LIDVQNVEPALTLQTLLLFLLSVAMGAIVAAVLMPAWFPGLAGSVLGESPKVFWFLSRASALVSFALLWLSMALGLTISNKLARLWPGGPAAFDVHQYTSLLGLALAIFHALILMGDAYIAYDLQQVLIPFASVNYKPIWVGLGQLGLYGWALVAFSFYVRAKTGTRTWRTIHFVSFAVFMLGLVHGLMSGTDSGAVWVARLYWYAGGSLFALLCYRILVNPRLPFLKIFAKPTPAKNISAAPMQNGPGRIPGLVDLPQAVIIPGDETLVVQIAPTETASNVRSPQTQGPAPALGQVGRNHP